MNARPRISDTFLSTLCWHSRVAFRNWKAAGCPKSGPEYEMRKKCKRDVSSHLSKCRARLERRTIQKRDETFASHHPKRFKSHSSKTQGSNLTINGKLASQRYVQAVAASPISSWPKVWDSALEKGAFGTSCSLALLRLLSLHTYSDNKCPVPNCSYVVGEDSLCSHFLADHTTFSITAEQCVYFLENCSEEIYSYGKTLNQIFRNIWN